jgi:hypothetical protein
MADKSIKAGRFIRNPDVVVHEEDEDGALVFNPDNDQVKVLNRTGFFIWRLCDGTNDLDGMIIAVNNAYAGAAGHQVARQVASFIDEMVRSGFVGTVENG